MDTRAIPDMPSASRTDGDTSRMRPGTNGPVPMITQLDRLWLASLTMTMRVEMGMVLLAHTRALPYMGAGANQLARPDATNANSAIGTAVISASASIDGPG